MKRKLLAASAAILLGTATASCAQPYGGMGPGMMGGGHGPGYGQGHGMMGGYGPGYGMGPAMMGHGHGHGYGMGPGMMMGGGYGMGPGTMGYGSIPNLTDEQRTKLAEIQHEYAKTHWALMSTMHSEGGPMALMHSGDEKAARQGYDAMAAAHKQMFESSLEMRKRMDAVLTDEQRAQTRRYGR